MEPYSLTVRSPQNKNKLTHVHLKSQVLISCKILGEVFFCNGMGLQTSILLWRKSIEVGCPPPDWMTFQAKLPSNAIQTQDLLIENLAHCTKTATGLSILRALHLLGTGIDSHVWNHHRNNVMGTASVFQLRGPIFDSQRITLCIIVNSR